MVQVSSSAEYQLLVFDFAYNYLNSLKQSSAEISAEYWFSVLPMGMIAAYAT